MHDRQDATKAAISSSSSSARTNRSRTSSSIEPISVSSPIRARISPEQAKQIIAKAKPIYHLIGRPAQRRGRAVRDADGARLPARHRRLADRQRDSRQRHRLDHAGRRSRRPRPQRRLVLPLRHQRNRRPRQGAGVPYWGKYVFHDDNRDINYSQVEMRSLLDWYLQWHPPIMHDLHQAQTLLYTFSGQAPQNPNLDPILYGELPMMANFEMAQMAKYGMPGVWTHGFVDMWSPGYLAFMSSNHNGMIRMYEIQGTSGANTTKMRLGNPNAEAGGTARGRARRRPAAAAAAIAVRQPGAARMVSPVAGDRRVRLVAAQQHELRRNRRADGAAVHVAVPENHPRELLHQVAQLGRNGPQRNRRRLRDSGRTARHDPRRARWSTCFACRASKSAARPPR